jgi:hypothetical protein
MLQGFGDAVLWAEALEDQLLMSRKHAAAMQSKLDAAFAKYHNDIKELQAKGDDFVVWTSLGPLPRWVPGPTTRWAPGTTRLALHGT